MKKVVSGIFLALSIIVSSSPAYAADIKLPDIQLIVEGVTIPSDVKPEMRNNRTMVPLRVISENLGAKVNWSNTEVTLTKGDMKVILTLNSNIAVLNGKRVQMDVKAYTNNNRIFVPLRFIAETFDCHVNYKDLTVTVDTEPFHIDHTKIKALQYEYHMTMGGVVNQIKGNAYIEAIYNIFAANSKTKVEAPADYTWSVHYTTPGGYYKIGQFDFLDQEENSVKRYDIYSLVRSTSIEVSDEIPKWLIYEAGVDQWYLFNDTAKQSIYQLIDTATSNGFLTTISNTVP